MEGSVAEAATVTQKQTDASLWLIHHHSVTIENKMKDSENYEEFKVILDDLGRDQPSKEDREAAKAASYGKAVPKEKGAKKKGAAAKKKAK